MRKADCILVRVGEQALKSRMVRALWFKRLKDNIKHGLKDKSIEFVMETNPNRIFIYTEEIEKASELLTRVFGVTSISPVWTCHSRLDEIRVLASDVASEVLDENKSFAVRARTAGKHSFSSKEIMEDVGGAVKRVTNANVNLSNPDETIFIEARSRNASVFTKKIKCEGGLPMGVSGKVLAIVKNENDLAAAWLIAKRGCDIVIISENEMKYVVENFQQWLVGRKLRIYFDGFDDWEQIYEENGCGAIASTSDGFKQDGVLSLNPLFALPENLADEILSKITAKKS